MNDVFHSLVSTYCFYNDEHLSLDCTETDLTLISGYSADEIQKKFQNELLWMILPDDRPGLFEALKEPSDKVIEFTMRVRNKNGRAILTVNKIRRVICEDQTVRFYGVMMDVSESNDHQLNMNKAMEQYQIILSQTKNVTFELDITSDTISFSERWNDFFGYTPTTKNFIATLPANSHIHPADIPALLQNFTALKKGDSYRSMDIRISTGGQFVWFCLRATGIYDTQGRLQKIIGIMLNIDEEKKESSALQARAECDSLTKLLNKATSKVQAEEYLNSYPNGAYCALMVIDLDNFKQVNDRYGHMFGDTVLLKAAEAIHHSFRSRDLVARIGGDEFMVLMKDVSNQALVEERCDKMLTSFQSLLANENVDHSISCSIGVALSPHHGTTFDELFKKADEAMYTAKNHGKNKYSVYSSNIYYY